MEICHSLFFESDLCIKIRVSTQLHPHGCVGHCYFLDLNNSASILVIRAKRQKEGIPAVFTPGCNALIIITLFVGYA